MHGVGSGGLSGVGARMDGQRTRMDDFMQPARPLGPEVLSQSTTRDHGDGDTGCALVNRPAPQVPPAGVLVCLRFIASLWQGSLWGRSRLS